MSMRDRPAMSLSPSDQSHHSTFPHHVGLLDSFGYLISHDRLTDSITRTPFCTSTGLTLPPNLSLWMERPIMAGEDPIAVKAKWYKHLSLPYPFPKIDAVIAQQDLIALRCREGSKGWVGVDHEADHVQFHVANLTDTAMFLPLTKEAWRGLTFLFDRTQAEVRTVDDCALTPATPAAEGQHKITLGDVTLSLAGNLAELTQLGQISIGKEAIATLQRGDNPVYASSFIVHRIA